jgi:hypothetical protein
MKFEREQIASEKIWIYINESKNLWNLMKVDKIIIYIGALWNLNIGN